MPDGPAHPVSFPILSARPAGGPRGRLRVPAAADVGHRALVVALLAIGETAIDGVPETDALARTIDACRALGGRAERRGDGRVVVSGVGIGGLVAPRDELRVDPQALGALVGACAGHPIVSRFAAAAPLPTTLRDALSRMGARLEHEGEDLLVHGTREAIPILLEASPDAATSAAVLLAGLNGPGLTTLVEPAVTGDATAALLARAGATIREAAHGEGGRVLRLDGWPELVGRPLALAADPARAAAFVLAGIAAHGSEIILDGLDRDGPSAALLAACREMGADIVEQEAAAADLACVRVRAGALRGTTFAAPRMQALGPALPALVLAAACASGESRFAEIHAHAGARRLAAVRAALDAMGVANHVAGGDLVVEGAGQPPRGGITVDAAGDAGLAASLLALGTAMPGGLALAAIGGAGRTLEQDLPGLVAQLRGLGADVEESARWAS